MTTASGSVVTGEGWPLAGASVTVLSAAGEQVGRATSGADGRFALPDLVAGAATLLVAAPSHEPQARSVTVPAADRWDLGPVRLARQGSPRLPPAGRWVIDAAHSSITATAHHLGLSAVHGRFTEFEGVVEVADPFEASAVSVRIGASSIDTASARRDEHLRSADFLDVAEHPVITYAGSGLERSGGGWVLHGQLTLLGTTRPVDLAVSFTGVGADPWGGTRAAFSATATLDRDDFRMHWSQAVDVGVAVFGTTLRVAIDVEAVLAPS